MKYALINSKREVMEIKESTIANTNPNLSVVELPDEVDFVEGDEVNFYIVLSFNADGAYSHYSAVKQTPFIQTILAENKSLKDQLALVQSALDDLIIGGAL